MLSNLGPGFDEKWNGVAREPAKANTPSLFFSHHPLTPRPLSPFLHLSSSSFCFRRVEDYDLHKQLYKGKASLLYAATCRATKARVALKLYRKARLSELNWAQVEREVRLHSALVHPHIVALYAAFEDADHVYLAQEFAGGGDLYEELKRSGGAMAEARVAAAVIAPALAAVRYLHFLGVIHRDIKPENILLASPHLPLDGTGGDAGGTGACLSAPGLVVKLADFGLSINHRVERPVTRAGTLDYMAPEVLVCPEKARPEDNKEKAVLEYDPSIDVWALGVLAYELVSGRPPFERATRAETCDCIMYRRPSFPAWMSAGLVAYVSSSCSKSARKRPGAVDMAHHPWVASHALPPAAAAAAGARAAAHLPAPMSLDAPPTPSSGKVGGSVDSPLAGSGIAAHHSGPSAAAASAAAAAAAAHDAPLSSVLSWAGSSVKSLSRRLLGSSSAAAPSAAAAGGADASSPPPAHHRLGTSGTGRAAAAGPAQPLPVSPSGAAGAAAAAAAAAQQQQHRAAAMQRQASAAALAASQQLHAAASAPAGSASLAATFDAAAAAVAAHQQVSAGGRGPLQAGAPSMGAAPPPSSLPRPPVASPFLVAPPHPGAASAPSSPFAAAAGSPMAAEGGGGIKAFRSVPALAGPSGSAPASPQAAMAAAAAAAAAAAQAHALPPAGTAAGGGANGARLAAWRRRVASGTAPPGAGFSTMGSGGLGGPASSGDLCDTPCRPGVVFPSGRGRGGARTADAVAAARAAAVAKGGASLASSASSALDDKAAAAAAGLTRGPAAKRSLSQQLAGAGVAGQEQHH